MDITYQTNYWFGFPESNSDIIINLTHWQYWWWFWFTYLLCLYYFIFLRVIRNRLMKFHPKMVTSYRAHGKWGDFIVCILPITWCINILSNSNFILRMLEWQTESSLFTVRVRGKQWYWIYKIEVKTLLNINQLSKNVAHNKWYIFNVLDSKSNYDYLNIMQIKDTNSWLYEYLYKFNKNFKTTYYENQNLIFNSNLNKNIIFNKAKFINKLNLLKKNVNFFNNKKIEKIIYKKPLIISNYKVVDNSTFKHIALYVINELSYRNNQNYFYNTHVTKGNNHGLIYHAMWDKKEKIWRNQESFKKLLDMQNKKINKKINKLNNLKKIFFIIKTEKDKKNINDVVSKIYNLSKVNHTISKNEKVFNNKINKKKEFVYNASTVFKMVKNTEKSLNQNNLKKKEFIYNTCEVFKIIKNTEKNSNKNINLKNFFAKNLEVSENKSNLKNKEFVYNTCEVFKIIKNTEKNSNKNIDLKNFFTKNLKVIEKTKSLKNKEFIYNTSEVFKLLKNSNKNNLKNKEFIYNTCEVFKIIKNTEKNSNKNIDLKKFFAKNLEVSENKSNLKNKEFVYNTCEVFKIIKNTEKNSNKNIDLKNFFAKNSKLIENKNNLKNKKLTLEKTILLTYNLKKTIIKNKYTTNMYNNVFLKLEKKLNKQKILFNLASANYRNFYIKPKQLTILQVMEYLTKNEFLESRKKLISYDTTFRLTEKMFSEVKKKNLPLKLVKIAEKKKLTKIIFKNSTNDILKNFYNNKNFNYNNKNNLFKTNKFKFIQNNNYIRDDIERFSRFNYFSKVNFFSVNFINLNFLKNLNFSNNNVMVEKNLPENIYLVIKQKKFVPVNRVIFFNNKSFVMKNSSYLNLILSGEEKLSNKSCTKFYFKTLKNKNLNFDNVNYRRLLRTKRILVLPINTNITIITNSFDVVHSWFIPGLGIKLDCVPGRSTHHTINIDHSGFYYGQCAEICGRYHHHMPIRICALPFEHFLIWWYHFGIPYYNCVSGKELRKKTVKSGIKQYNW